jgi:hypothetical protein
LALFQADGVRHFARAASAEMVCFSAVPPWVDVGRKFFVVAVALAGINRFQSGIEKPLDRDSDSAIHGEMGTLDSGLSMYWHFVSWSGVFEVQKPPRVADPAIGDSKRSLFSPPEGRSELPSDAR